MTTDTKEVDYKVLLVALRMAQELSMSVPLDPARMATDCIDAIESLARNTR